MDEHGNEVLNLGSFTLLPQHVVRLILARDELRADEFTKFQVRYKLKILIYFLNKTNEVVLCLMQIYIIYVTYYICIVGEPLTSQID